MPGPIILENDHFRLHVWPAIGGHISSLLDTADGYELLMTNPAEPSSPRYDTPFTQPGWAECLPAVAAGPYPLAPYLSIAVPDHGELWSLPTTAVPALQGITTVWHGLRFGYRFVRKLQLQGPTIVAEYTLVNLAPFEFRFVWAMHATMSPMEPARLPSALVGQEAASEQPFLIEYPNRRRTLSIAFASDFISAYWAVHAERGAIAVGPMTGRHQTLADAVDDGSAGRVGPMATVKWAVRITSAEAFG